MEFTRQMAEQMVLIRAFEEKVEEAFEGGFMRGTTHGSVGQEAIPAILMANLDKQTDYVFATHRCHGHYIAYRGDVYSLAAEMMGRRDGPVYGAGGSQHIRWKNFYTNGITGGMAPEAVGVALGLKRKGEGVSVAVLGDGGFNEGYVQEALNLAAIYQVPVLFLLENNRYAMSTRSADFTAGSIEERVRSYHIPYYHASTSDVQGLMDVTENAVKLVRNNRCPAFLEVETFRLCGHSKSDDCAYMEENERRQHVENDPLFQVGKLGDYDMPSLLQQARKVVDEAFVKAEQSEEISLAEFEKQREGARRN